MSVFLARDTTLRIVHARSHAVRLFGLLRTLFERFALTLLLIASAGLLVLSKADVKLVRTVEEVVADGMTPVMAALREPVVAARELAERFGRFLAVYEENARLREENRRLLEWRAKAVRLEVQNRGLREMLAMPEPEAAPRRTVARIVADSGGPFVQTRLIDAGSRRGVREGMAVIDERGMVGRVVHVGEESARVLLLTDFNSRIPVVVAGSRDQALLVGDNTPHPKLRFLPLNPGLRVGDRVLTSGADGLLPPGLPVGEITAVGDQGIKVTPYVDWRRLDDVAVLDYRPVPPPPADGLAAGTPPARPEEGGAAHAMAAAEP